MAPRRTTRAAAPRAKTQTPHARPPAASPDAAGSAPPLAAALVRLSQAVALIDGGGIVRWCNPPLAECYLHRAQGVACPALPWRELFRPLFPDAAERTRLEAADEEVARAPAGRVEVANLTLAWDSAASGQRARKDARVPRRVDLTLCRLDDPPDAPAAPARGWVAWYFNDVTTQVKAEEELEAQLRLSRKLATLGELASAVAHEIKNPLGIILSAAQIVMNPDRPDDQKRQAAVFIQEEAKRLDERLQSFLKFSRPKPPSFLVQNIHRVLTQTIIAYQTLAREGLALKTQFGPNLPHVRIDADQMQQVFLNLLLNADQAMPAGGSIAIATCPGPDATVQIEIADEGIGLPDGSTSRLFEPFFSTKPQGTGLGLATSMQIVVAHQGTIEARNRPGGGAAFVVTLPAARTKAE
jgi:signal transduction histidine kinase